MKHPPKTSELYEFNLGKTPELRCVEKTNTTCGKCESCLLTNKFNYVKEWFFRAGDKTRKRFVFGLVNKIKSKDVLKNVASLLQPMASKDFTYASSRTTPSLSEDISTMSMDRALDPYNIEAKVSEVWRWYEEAYFWTQSKFLVMILTECEPHLLCAIFAECKKTLAGLEGGDPADDYEASSIDSSRYTYNSSDRPDLELLTSAQSEYEEVIRDPFTPFSYLYDNIPEYIEETRSERPFTATVTIDDTIRDDSGDESLDDADETDQKERRDFIHQLPVHISKYILSMLDTASLNNCVCVSKVWRDLTEQVHTELLVGQSVKEEVMLMQGSGAQGFNPKYAADIYIPVPNVHVNSYKSVRTEENEVATNYKSESNFNTAYSGYSTRKVIMEERNVYCGAYNVLVLNETHDPNRVIHTDGGNWIALGSKDNRVRFVNVENGKSVGPVISGHSGSICCLIINEAGNCVYSGSYDTSVRCWSLETGKCLKIFRGHRASVLCIKIHNSLLVTGSKDKRCKVWDIETKKCLRTFKHQFPVSAVALSDDLCISGCQGGMVKVWDITAGKLIKKVLGHHGPVTTIQVDRWHIATGSKDGYILVWSTQGDHSRCLAALRHPKEVLCSELMYLRVVTGALDGKIRIWNIITGQCLRIMRGNSHSDPINCLLAVGNRITLNTARTLLVLNFEPIEYDYFLANDRLPPRVRYSSYGDTPIRKLPYPYIRAQRMKSAGASNKKIVKNQSGEEEICSSLFDTQIPHSGRSLSRKVMSSARRIQSAHCRAVSSLGQRPNSRAAEYLRLESNRGSSRDAPASAPATLGKHRISMAPSAALLAQDSDDDDNDGADLSRRVSWGFENRFIPDVSAMTLANTKTLLHSQIRNKGVVPPDFIYLALNAIQAAMKPTEASKTFETDRRTKELSVIRRLSRPNSGPCDIDPRTKVPLDKTLRDQLRALANQGVKKDENLADTLGLNTSAAEKNQESFTRYFEESVKNTGSTQTKTGRAKSAISSSPTSPVLRAVVARPNTASGIKALTEITEGSPDKQQQGARAKSTKSGLKTGTLKYIHVPDKPVPMLMYSKDMMEKIQSLKHHRSGRSSTAEIHQQTAVSTGKVSEHNDPLRRNVDFKLRTHNQVQKEASNIMQMYKSQAQERIKKAEMEKRRAWHAKVKETMNADKQKLFQSKTAAATTVIR